MSMELMVTAMKAPVGNPIRKLVLIKLADNANDRGECWPSYQHIADQCEIDRSTVRRHIKHLEQQGLLRIENREGPLGNSSNMYLLRLGGVGAPPTPVGTGSTPVGAPPTPPVGTGSTRTSHSSEPVIEPYVQQSSDKGFDRFWKLYPKKRGRKDALKAWHRLKPDDQLQDTLIAALGNHRLSRDWLKDGGQYVPLAATWLNGERWADELAPASQTNPSERSCSLLTNLPRHTPEEYENNPHGKF